MMNRRASVSGFSALAAILAGWLCGCHGGGGSRPELMQVAGGWFTAIQERNFERLARYDANAPRDPASPDFAEWTRKVAQTLDRYELQRLAGAWQPDETGYAVVRATLIGANPGTFWGAPGVEGAREAPVLIIRASFAYDEVGEQGLPEGTVVYAQGFPVGKVHRLVIGAPDKPQVDLIDSIEMKVHFERVRAPGDKDPHFRVRRIELLEDTAKHRLVTWVF